MVAEVVVIAPVLNRPANAHPLMRSLASTTDRARLVFACSPSDEAQITSCRATGAETIIVPWEPERADWARKLEYVRGLTEEPYMLLGADDIRFHPGWLEAVLQMFKDYDVGVVGTDDMHNRAVRSGGHSTHPVVCRGYADKYGTIDNPDLMLHDGYWHQYVDNELIETAKSRGCWGFAHDARVEHRHPLWHNATDDATYERGRDHYREDQILYQQRRRLWQ